MAILFKLIYRFSSLPIRIPSDFLLEVDKWIIKFTWNCKGSKIVNTIMKKIKVGGITVPNFKNWLQIKTVWCWPKDWYRDTWNRIESPGGKVQVWSIVTWQRCHDLQWGVGKQCCQQIIWGQLNIDMHTEELIWIPTSHQSEKLT